VGLIKGKEKKSRERRLHKSQHHAAFPIARKNREKPQEKGSRKGKKKGEQVKEREPSGNLG